MESRSIYINRNAMAIAGKTKPTVGTRIDGRKEAAISIQSFVDGLHLSSYLN
jgi:hypothetical protein